MRRTRELTFAFFAILVVLVACRREPPAQGPAAAPEPAATATSAATQSALQDVSINTPDYVIGISYPAVAARYPLLAAELKRYAEACRADLMKAVGERKKGAGEPPYELVLPYGELLVSPTLVAVAVDGSRYTGGAHGAPLIARWVWMPQRNSLLRAADLVAPSGWDAISALVREQLHTALSERVDADALPPGERAQVLKSAGRMIEDGTTPDAEHFSQFEPVVGADGRIKALRFVFPPYQVGPYSDGTQTVEIPAAQLLPYIAPEYRSLFQGG